MKRFRSEWIICCFSHLKEDKFYWHFNDYSATGRRKVVLLLQPTSLCRPTFLNVAYAILVRSAGSPSFVSIWSSMIAEIERDRSLAAKCFHKIADNRSGSTAIMWKRALRQHYLMVSIQQINWKLHSIAYVDTTQSQKPSLSNTF